MVARKENSTVMVLDLKSGTPHLTIDTSIEVYGLRVIENTVVVIGDTKVITWNLPGGDYIPNARVNCEDCTQMIHFGNGHEGGRLVSTSISLDLHFIALTKDWDHCLYVYETSSGQCLVKLWTDADWVWFAPDGHTIWCTSHDGRADAWVITGSDRINLVHRTPVVDIEHPPHGHPWQSSHGYQVMNGKWALSPDRKRLLMLPPAWQSPGVYQVWNGQFLALLNGSLSEPVILDLGP